MASVACFKCAPRISVVLTIGSLLLMQCSPAFGKPPRGAFAGPNPIITVRIHNYARVPHETLANAERVTSEILGEAQVTVLWVDCDIAVPVEVREPACARPMGPVDFVLNLVDRIQPLSADLREIAMGVAAVPQHSTEGYLAYLSIQQASGAAQEYSAPLEVILGLGAAHEIGHLLLGDNAHAPEGLMKSRWGAAELKHASAEKFSFTWEQSRRIQLNLLAREQRASHLTAEIRIGNVLR
jgi:hypothetical protein